MHCVVRERGQQVAGPNGRDLLSVDREKIRPWELAKILMIKDMADRHYGDGRLPGDAEP